MLVLSYTVVLVTIAAKSVIKYVFENKMLTFQNEHVGVGTNLFHTLHHSTSHRKAQHTRF